MLEPFFGNTVAFVAVPSATSPVQPVPLMLVKVAFCMLGEITVTTIFAVVGSFVFVTVIRNS